MYLRHVTTLFETEYFLGNIEKYLLNELQFF